MGAQNFEIIGYGTSANEVFANLVHNAEYEYGHDSYNGTISTCHLGRVRKLADKYTEKVELKAQKIIEDEDYGEKWIACGLDLGVVRYEIRSIKKVVNKPKKVAEYRQRFVVLKIDDRNLNGTVVSHFATKKEADDEALWLLKKNPFNSYEVAKRPIDIKNGDDIVTTFKIETKTRMSKPKTVPIGCTVHEIHKYIFYGWAAC